MFRENDGMYVMSNVVLSDNGLRITVAGLAGCFGTMDGLGMFDFFLAGSVLECCSGCDWFGKRLCSEKMMTCI